MENTTEKRPRGRPKKDPEDKAQFKTISVRKEIYDQIGVWATQHNHTIADEVTAPPPSDVEPVEVVKDKPKKTLKPIAEVEPSPELMKAFDSLLGQEEEL